jgi:hypothetical protein
MGRIEVQWQPEIGPGEVQLQAAARRSSPTAEDGGAAEPVAAGDGGAVEPAAAEDRCGAEHASVGRCSLQRVG